MMRHDEVNRSQLFKLIKAGVVTFAGNRRLKIYGALNCASGKRMKSENRIFFNDSSEAIDHGFRPCAHCLRKEYEQWKAETGRKV